MPGSSLGTEIWESSSQGRSLCSDPEAWAASQAWGPEHGHSAACLLASSAESRANAV